MKVRIKLVVWKDGKIVHQELNGGLSGENWKERANEIYAQFGSRYKKEITVYGENGIIKNLKNW